MAAFLQPADPWIENTYIHAISFDASTSTAAPAIADNEPSQENQSPTESNSQQWDQTENTIPSGLLPSQPRSDQPIPPSRQSKIVQIIYRGGEGWDGNRVMNGCPPYVLLHDGQYSTVAFLSEVAQRSIGMNVERNEKSDLRNRPKQRLYRYSDREIRLKKKCLASLNQYTVSTVWGCVYSGEMRYPQQVHRQQQQQQAQKHMENVLSTLDIPQNLHAHLLPLQHLFLCLYITGTITVIGAENQGLIGESVDAHCSVGVRRELRGFNHRDDDGQDGSVGYGRLMRRLEEVHNMYRETNDMSSYEERDDSIRDWPWISRLPSRGDRQNPEVGDVTSLLNRGDDLEEVLGQETEEDEEQIDGDDNAIIGRASTGTYLAKWDIDNDQDSDENGAMTGSDKPKASAKTNDTTASNSIQVGNVQDLFSNYEYLQDVIAFTQDQTPVKPTTQPRKERDGDLQSPGAIVPFIGIDQMIASQSQDSEEDSDPTLPLTQVETFESALEDHDDSQEEAEVESKASQSVPISINNEQQPVNSQPFSQDVSLTHSQSIQPEIYFSAAEEEEDTNIESQIPIHVAKRAAMKKELQKKNRDKLRYSQLPIESQIPLITRKESNFPTLDKCNKNGTTKAAPDDMLQNTEIHDKPTNANTDKDSTINALTNELKDDKVYNTADSQSESQVAGEGSEENSPQEVEETVTFDCVQDEIASEAEEQEEESEIADPSKHDNDQVQADLKVASTTDIEPPVRPRRVIREFDMDRFLWRSKRLCRR